MKISSQVLLNFLLNSFWQIALVAGLASLSSWLLRNSAARYRHWIWVTALLLSLGVPVTTSWQSLTNNEQPNVLTNLSASEAVIPPLTLNEFKTAEFTRARTTTKAFLLSQPIAATLLTIYSLIVLFSLGRLVQAWIATRRLRSGALELIENSRLDGIVQHCALSLTGSDERVQLSVSDRVAVPITIGMFAPLIILPDQLVVEDDEELLTSAIGHELIHVRRRDYALNLVYELLYLPLSFHPCAALIRRRVRQTRELSCDEVVAERILTPEAYARSLVKLASSAPSLQRLSVSTTVGIADADILEARIMSLLKKTKSDTRRKRMILIAISLLLLIPCFAAASFAMKFDLESTETVSPVQEQAKQERERTEPRKVDVTVRMDPREVQEMKMREAADPSERAEIENKRELEFKLRSIRQTALVKSARISMDQAIQIANSQKPGKVLQCSLDAEHWKEPGVLAEDSFVFYRVLLVANDEVDTGVITHVWVNAIDGSIIKTEKELPRKREPQQ